MVAEVIYWGSLPGTNDDSIVGYEFDNLVDAINFYNGSIKQPFSTQYVAYVQLVEYRSGHKEYRKNPGYKPSRDNSSDWNREYQHQSAMGGNY